MGISDDIIKQIESALNVGVSKDNLRKTGKEVAKSIKTRTRLGKGVSRDGASLNRLDKLSTNYKKQRKGLKKRGKLSQKTTPSKSNLTKSGKMLDNIKSRLSPNGFEIYIQGETNKDKAKYAAENGRPFMNLAKFEIKLIIENILERIRRAN